VVRLKKRLRAAITLWITTSVVVLGSATGSYLLWQAVADTEATLVIAGAQVDEAESDIARAMSRQSSASDALALYYIEAFAYGYWYVSIVYDLGSLTANLNAADSAVSSAEARSSSAWTRLDTELVKATQERSALNLMYIFGGSASGALVLASLIVTGISIRRRRLAGGFAVGDDATLSPAWTCAVCGTANDAGIFCISCGEPRHGRQQGTVESRKTATATATSNSTPLA
jgi:hypothetical protein